MGLNAVLRVQMRCASESNRIQRGREGAVVQQPTRCRVVFCCSCWPQADPEERRKGERARARPSVQERSEGRKVNLRRWVGQRFMYLHCRTKQRPVSWAYSTYCLALGTALVATRARQKDWQENNATL